MVAEPGLPAVRTRSGAWYFDARPELRLLHVKGEDAHGQAGRALKREKLSHSIVEGPDRHQANDALLLVKVGKGRQLSERRKKLEAGVVESLRQAGLGARISVPGFVKGEVAFGISDEIVVQFESSATKAQIQAFAKEYDLDQLRPLVWMGNAFLFRHTGGASMELLDLVERLKQSSLVAFAELNLIHRVKPHAFTPNDFLYPATPHLQLIQADDAWEAIETSTTVPAGGSPDIVIGILDPYGVDPDHPELTGALSDGSQKQIANFDFSRWVPQTNPNLEAEHGTQCAGSATGKFDNGIGNCGVAPNCRLIGARIDLTASSTDIADAWVWMAGFPTGSTHPGFPAQLTNGADIISNSWGLPPTAPDLDTLRSALDFLTTYPRNGKGILMVFSAGNFGYEVVEIQNPLTADPRTLVVGASINVNPTNPVDSILPDPAGETLNLPAIVDTRAYYSPYGLSIDLVCPSNTTFGLQADGVTLADFVDPIMAPVRSGAVRTALHSAAAAGAPTIEINSGAGFFLNSRIMIGPPSDPNSETRTINAVNIGPNGFPILTMDQPVNAHPAGTFVWSRIGDWPSSSVTHTTLRNGVAVGAAALPVQSVTGFAVGDAILVGDPGTLDTEPTTVMAVGGQDLTVVALKNAHLSGTSVDAGVANFGMNRYMGFGATSHCSPTVAGAAALVLSVKPDLNWLELRSILLDSATPIDTGQANPTGAWQDLDGDGLPDFSQWYGNGRLNVYAAVTRAISLTARTDAVVRDNLMDTGAVPSTGWHAESPDIWVRRTNDPIPALPYTAAPPHQNPAFGQDNWIYLRVANRGTAPAKQIFLRALVTHFPGIEFLYPSDWEPSPHLGTTPTLPLAPASYLIGQLEVNNLTAGQGTIVKLLWPQGLVPPESVIIGGSTVHWHPCLLLEAAPHDGPPVVAGLAYPVTGDNNLAQRNISVNYPANIKKNSLTFVGAGTRAAAGVDGLVVDRSQVPPHVRVIVKSPDSNLMKYWIDYVQYGRGFVKTGPLGATPKKHTIEVTNEPPVKGIGVTLLEKTRIAVHSEGNVLVIEAAAKTHLTMFPGGNSSEKTLKGDIGIGTYEGETVLFIEQGAGSVILPMRLAANEWAPIFVGSDLQNTTQESYGRIFLSQIRGDGDLSGGYTISI
jgi:hypothetical protein